MAFLLGLFGLGAHYSDVKIDKEQINKTIQSVVAKVTVKQDVDATFQQMIRISNSKILHCVPDLTQKMDINVTTIQEFTSNLTTELIKSLQQNIDTQIDNQMEPRQSAFGGTQLTMTTTKMKDRIHNILENSISIDYLNEQVKRINALQSGDYSNVTIDACPGYEDNLNKAINSGSVPMLKAVKETCDTNQKCPMSQDFKAVVLSRQVSNSITEIITNDTVVQELNTNIKNTVKPVAEFMTAGGGLSCSSCCLICLLIIAVALYYMWDSDTTKQGITTAGNVYKPMPSPMTPPK